MKIEQTSNDARVFVKDYLPLLNKAQEFELFTNLKNSNYNDKYFNKVILQYSPIIRKSMRELAKYNIPEDELLSEGLLALFHAAKRYDPSQGGFSAFAKPWCKGLMYAYITKHFFMVKICTDQPKKRLFYALRKLLAVDLSNNNKIHPTRAQLQIISDEYGVSINEIEAMYGMFKSPWDSLSIPANNTNEFTTNLTKLDLVPAKTKPTDQLVIDENIHTFQLKLIDDAIKRVLTEREEYVIRWQKPYNTENPKTLQQIGNEMDLTKERIRQIRNTAADKLIKDIKKHVRETLDMADTDDFL